jgi:hypothetical protein
MKQKQKRPLAGLHRMDGAVGEKSIHAGSLSGWQGTARLESHRMARRRVGAVGLIIQNSTFSSHFDLT